MKIIGEHKKSTTLVLGFVLAFQLLTGTGFFCAAQYAQAPNPSGNESRAFADTNASVEDVFASPWKGSVSERESGPCTCKKHKKCPTIPRSTLISNPNHRLAEVERLLNCAGCDGIAPVESHRLALRGGPSYVESVSSRPFPSSSPLAGTCVLLI